MSYTPFQHTPHTKFRARLLDETRKFKNLKHLPNFHLTIWREYSARLPGFKSCLLDLGKLFNLPVPQLLCLLNEDNNSTYLIGLYELICREPSSLETISYCRCSNYYYCYFCCGREGAVKQGHKRELITVNLTGKGFFYHEIWI